MTARDELAGLGSFRHLSVMQSFWHVAAFHVCSIMCIKDPSSDWLGVGGLRGVPNQYKKMGSSLSRLASHDDFNGPDDIHSKTDSIDHAMLVSTAYWNIASKRGSPDESDAVYKSCMVDVLTLNTSIAIYGDSRALQEMKNVRGNTMPPLVSATEAKINELPPCAEHEQILFADQKKYTNDGDVPSVELGCIWDGKPGLLARSMRQQPGYAWYAWLDVCMGHGEIAFHHGSAPWPNRKRLQQLPQDRIIVSYSEENRCEDCRGTWRYCHCLAGTAFVVPAVMVENFAGNFSQKVSECLDAFTLEETGAYVCLSDQVIMTKMFLDNPDLFFVSSSGYGSVATSYLSNED